MAISAPHYRCLKELHRRGELPQGGALLEIGEANWYGDLDPVGSVMSSEDYSRLIDHDYEHVAFAVVRWLYGLLFKPTAIMAIDMNGPTAMKLDLNEPVFIEEPELSAGMGGGIAKFSTVYNHGTLEHVFNPAQVLRTMHDHCEVGGLMIHESPFTGWIDHGFWNIQPTLYYDLAAANGYDLRYMAVTHIEHQSAVEIHSREQLLKMAAAGGVPNNAMLYVAMRKVVDAEFKIPMQGFYAETISAEASEAWRALR